MRNRTALCALAKHYDDMEALDLPFYEQGTWGYGITPDADYGEAKQFLKSYVIDSDEDGPYTEQHLTEALSRLYDEHTCFTFGCVAGNAAAALGYEAKKDLSQGPGFYDWSEVRPKGSEEGFRSVSNVAADLLGFNWQEGEFMFGSEWKPREGLSMGSVLRRLAGGASMLFVSHERCVRNGYWRFDLDEMSNEELKYLRVLWTSRGSAVPSDITNRLADRGVLV